MCRFLMARSGSPFRPAPLLERFAELAALSPAPNGDWQGDGWGVCWIGPDDLWNIRKSLRPIWESSTEMREIPPSRFICAHARSASFPGQESVQEFNQPFTGGVYAFVFNGFLKGVTLPQPVPGRIGAQKIWHLLQDLLAANGPEESLDLLTKTLECCVREIQAMNIGLCDGTALYTVCRYTEPGSYYRLHFHDSAGLKAICSGPLEGIEFRPVPLGAVLVL